MARPGYNATRRNRNIGTAKSGHGQDNRLVIPWTHCRAFYERLVNPVEVRTSIGALSLPIVVEPTIPGFVHASTVDDIIRLLSLLPQAYLDGIELIVLRQPKRKERILSEAWGRLVYVVTRSYRGPAIILEAQSIGVRRWGKSLDCEDKAELERLRGDGHAITTDRRHHIITSTLESVRNTQLYRTLPHELGHNVHYLESVTYPGCGNDAELDRLNALYRKKPAREREFFAHRYAHEFRAHQKAAGRLPFARMYDADRIRKLGLQPEWFSAS